MTTERQSLLGLGVYTIPEAARLTGVSPRTIRRWVQGYTFDGKNDRRVSPPLWHPDISTVDETAALSFRDLLEVRFIQAFRSYGVSWRTIRIATRCAAEIVSDAHPFSTSRFKTDGKNLFAEIIHVTGEESLLNLVRRQYELKPVVEPYLFEGVEFTIPGIAPVRWWPLGRGRRVVIDPERSFGQPICDPESVPTIVLANAFRAEDSIEKVADWFEVDPRSVEDAVEFEDHLLAAA